MRKEATIMKSSDKEQALSVAITQIERQYGKGAIMKLGDSRKINIDTVPSGSLSLDIALGAGGIPKGRIIEIFGPESSGKIIFIYLNQIMVNRPLK
jgi:recombination protein RecA